MTVFRLIASLRYSRELAFPTARRQLRPPEGGVGAGASISGGMSYQFYPNVTNTEQIGGWGVNIGGSVAGNGGDVSFSLQQDKTGKVEDVKIGGTIPKIAIPTKMQYGGGAGVEGHLTVGYSFLIGTLTWKDLVGGIEEWAAESGIPVTITLLPVGS